MRIIAGMSLVISKRRFRSDPLQELLFFAGSTIHSNTLTLWPDIRLFSRASRMIPAVPSYS